jgi:hypothetical protein
MTPKKATNSWAKQAIREGLEPSPAFAGRE